MTSSAEEALKSLDRKGGTAMRISLKRANAKAKAAWNDPKWQRQEAPQPTVSERVEEEVRRIVDEALAPIVDQDGTVWRRTLNRPPDWRR